MCSLTLFLTESGAISVPFSLAECREYLMKNKQRGISVLFYQSGKLAHKERNLFRLRVLLLLIIVRCARPRESEKTLSVQRPQPHITNPWKEENIK